MEDAQNIIDTEDRLEISRQLHKQEKSLHLPEQGLWIIGKEKTVPDGTGEMYYCLTVDDSTEILDTSSIEELNELPENKIDVHDEIPSQLQSQPF